MMLPTTFQRPSNSFQRPVSNSRKRREHRTPQRHRNARLMQASNANSNPSNDVPTPPHTPQGHEGAVWGTGPFTAQLKTNYAEALATAGYEVNADGDRAA